jgi:MFS family permease
MIQAPAPQSPAITESTPHGRAPLWSRGFVLLCLATMLCYCSNYLAAVTLPLFVENLGGSPVLAGLVFTSFSVTSFILRPLIGHLADTWSVRGTLTAGAAILGSFGLLLVIPSLWVAFIANAIRGIGWGAFSASGSTAVALLAPLARRGEASGHYSIMATAAQAFSPALGLWLLGSTGQFSIIFLVAGVAGVLAAVALAFMPSVGTGRTSFRGAFALPTNGISLATFVERQVLLASLLLVCVTMTWPMTFAFVPLYAVSLGVENVSVYYIASGVTSILARIVIGPHMDRGSRGHWILAGYATLLLSFVAFILAGSIEGFVAAGVLSAIGLAMSQPALMAFAMDRAVAGRMGKAMATYSMFYRVGEGVGSPVAGVLIVAFGYGGMYLGAIALASLGLVLTLANWSTVGKPVGQAVPA